MAGHIDCVVGARPNFMKIAPSPPRRWRPRPAAACLVHTGQHYDASMSDVFFEQLGIRPPTSGWRLGPTPMPGKRPGSWSVMRTI